MNLEEKIFCRCDINYEKLEKYGFIFQNKAYSFEKNILNDTFKIVIQIDKNKNIESKIFELDLDEEYTNWKNENQNGEFVNKIRSEYLTLLEEIKKNCCNKKDFIFHQTNILSQKIFEKFGAKPEFLWKDSNAAVFRNQANKKWFGIIMDVDKSKIDKNKFGLVEVINVKIDHPETLWDNKSIFPAYHMNKKYWLTIVLDESLTNETIMDLINKSFENISNKK